MKKVSIVYINNQYVRGEELEIGKLFKIEDITDIAKIARGIYQSLTFLILQEG